MKRRWEQIPLESSHFSQKEECLWSGVEAENQTHPPRERHRAAELFVMGRGWSTIINLPPHQSQIVSPAWTHYAISAAMRRTLVFLQHLLCVRHCQVFSLFTSQHFEVNGIILILCTRKTKAQRGSMSPRGSPSKKQRWDLTLYPPPPESYYF